jgi:hypothetical protein
MMKTKKPPLRKPTPAVDMGRLDQFASLGLSQPPVQEAPTMANLPVPVEEDTREPAIVYPWEQPDVREDVLKGMGVPLSEPYLLKLRFIAEHTKWSQRKFCRARLEEAIDRELAKIVRELEAGHYSDQIEPDRFRPD